MPGFRHLFAAMLLLTGAAVAAPARAGDEKPLPLEEFIRAACAQDETLPILLRQELEARFQSALQVPADEFIASALAGYHASLASSLQGHFEIEAGLSALFPGTGTRVSAEYGQSEVALPSELQRGLTVTLAQDIARNAFGQETRLFQNLAGVGLKLAEVQLIEAYEDYLAGLRIHYYQWSLAHARWRASLSILAEMRRLEENMQDRLRQHVANATDVAKVHLQVLERETEALAREAEYAEWSERLRPWLPAPAANEAWVPVDPEHPAGPEPPPVDEPATPPKDSRTVSAMRLLERQNDLELQTAGQALLPSARLQIGYRAEGTESSLTNDREDLFAGAALTWNLSDAHAGLRRDLARVRQTRRVLENRDAVQRLEADLRVLQRQMDVIRRQADITRQQRTLARQVLADETKYYWQGRATINDTITAANQLAEYQYTAIQDRINRVMLQTEWLRLTDRLVSSRPPAQEGSANQP